MNGPRDDQTHYGRIVPPPKPPPDLEKRAVSIMTIISLGLASIFMLILLLMFVFFVVSCMAGLQGAGVS